MSEKMVIEEENKTINVRTAAANFLTIIQELVILKKLTGRQNSLKSLLDKEYSDSW
jgi:hypothetical protein